MAPGTISKFGAPCSNLRSFGRKRTLLKKVFVTFLELFSAPRSHSVRAFVPPRYATGCTKGIQFVPATANFEVTNFNRKSSLNHHKKVKVDPSRLIPQKPTENLKL